MLGSGWLGSVRRSCRRSRDCCAAATFATASNTKTAHEAKPVRLFIGAPCVTSRPERYLLNQYRKARERDRNGAVVEGVGKGRRRLRRDDGNGSGSEWSCPGLEVRTGAAIQLAQNRSPEVELRRFSRTFPLPLRAPPL